MSTYPAGTVAIATIRGVKGVRVFLADLNSDDEWTSEGLVGDTLWHKEDRDVTDVRPLVVLDPEPLSDDLRSLSQSLRRVEDASHGHAACADPIDRNRLMDLVRIIEAQTKPPRIPEPGLWGVVKARLSSGKNAMEWTAIRVGDWEWRVDDGGMFAWNDLIDPTLIRDGIES